MAIVRITAFKVINEADIQPILEQYAVVAKDNQKDGKPYITEVKAYKPIGDDRSQGYNLVAMTRFKSLDDMRYYDNECEAHKKMKEFAKGKVQPPPLILYGEAGM